MRIPSSSLVLAVFGATAIGFAATRDSETIPHVHVCAPSCKPSAPVTITLSNASVANGVVRFDYSVTPTIPGLRIDSTLDLPAGAKVIEHSRVSRTEVAANETFMGHGTIRLAAGTRGATLRVRCAIEFTGSDEHGDDATEIATSVAELLVGDAEVAVRNIDLPRVATGSEESLDVPAVRIGGSSR